MKAIIYKIALCVIAIVLLTHQGAFAYPDQEKGVIDLAVGAQPQDVAITLDNRFLLVTNQGTNTVSVIDTANFQVIGTIPLGAAGAPYKIAIDPDGNYAYVTKDFSNLIKINLTSLKTYKVDDTFPISGSEIIDLGTTGDLTGIDVVKDPANPGDYLLAVGMLDDSGGSTPQVHICSIPATGTETCSFSTRADPDTNAFISDVKIDTDFNVSGDSWVYFLTSLPGVVSGFNKLGAFDISNPPASPTATWVAGPVDGDLGEMALSDSIAAPDTVYIVDRVAQEVVELTYSSPNFIASGNVFPTTYKPYGIERVDVLNPSVDYLYITGSTTGVTSSIGIVDMSNLSTAIKTITLNGAADPRGIAASSATDGYVYTANSGDDTVSVITENPWISGVSLDPAVNDGINFTILTFTSDINVVGTFEVRRDSSVARGGTLLPGVPGSINAGENKQFNIPPSYLNEGDNEIFIFVKDDISGTWGRYAINVPQNAVPGIVYFKVEFGNERLYVTFEALDVSDISYYTIYYSTDSGKLIDDETGDLPDPFLGSTLLVWDFSPGSDKRVTIGGQTNNIPVYVRVRARDSANDGLLGEIKSAIPQVTFGLSDIKGESGGSGCAIVIGANNSPARLALPAIAVFLAFVIMRRRQGP